MTKTAFKVKDASKETQGKKGEGLRIESTINISMVSDSDSS